MKTKPKTKMSVDEKIKFIKAIYAYVMIAVAVFMFISGVYSSISTTVKLTVFDEYPYPGEGYYCTEFDENCEEDADRERKVQMVEDITRSVAWLIIGGGLLATHVKFARHLNEK